MQIHATQHLEEKKNREHAFFRAMKIDIKFSKAIIDGLYSVVTHHRTDKINKEIRS